MAVLRNFREKPLKESEKELAIQKTIDDINKKYGKGALVRGADARGLKIGRLKTGSLSLDVATGGGIAQGKLNEFYGPWSGGKSFVSMLTMAQTQRDYPEANVALIDFEGAFDAEWAKKVGVNVENLLISSPEWMEDGLQIAIDLIHSEDCALIVVDSLGAACPKAEHEGDITDFTVGLRARIGNKFVRKSRGKVDLLSDEIDLGQSTLLVINQEYQGIGPYAGTETPGGVQVKFGAMIRVRIRKGEVVNDPKDGTQIMQESRFIVVKNKTYSPHKAGAFWMSTKDNPKGKAGEIYRVGEVLTQGIISGVIQRSGSWYTLPKEFGLEKSLQGEAAVADWVEENPDKYPRLEELVLDSILRRGDG